MTRRLGSVCGVICGASVGALVTLAPGVAVVVAAAAFALTRLATFVWPFAALAGSVVLLYGFANIGVPVPWGARLPLAEVLLIGALPRAVTAGLGLHGRRARAAWLAFLLVGLGRLGADIERYGLLALRDFLLPLEAGFVLVGYRLGTLRRAQVEIWCAWLFVVAAVYYLGYPIQQQLADFSPTVGLQRPTALLGSYQGITPAILTGFFFMALVQPFGTLSWLVAAVFGCELLLVQTRGGYIGFAVIWAALFTAAVGNRRLRRVIRRRMLWAVATFLLGLVVVVHVGLQGRMGPTYWTTYAEQLRTLVGSEGLGSGSLSDRVLWASETVRAVRTAPLGWLVGAGYGSDLTGGFLAADSVVVRKPHNDYLEVFGRTGVVGLLTFGFLIYSLVAPVFSAARRSASGGGFTWWIFATQVAYLTIALFQPILAFPFGTIPFFMISGFGLAVADSVHA